jgi:hypothetical protein
MKTQQTPFYQLFDIVKKINSINPSGDHAMNNNSNNANRCCRKSTLRMSF